jgi:hypothetical protein
LIFLSASPISRFGMREVKEKGGEERLVNELASR